MQNSTKSCILSMIKRRRFAMGLFFKKKKEDKNEENKQNLEKTSIQTKNDVDVKKKTPEKIKKPVYRVIYDKEARLWLIKKDGAKRTIASFVTKEEALNRVKDLSSSNDLNYIVHKKNGKFQKK